MTKKKKAYIIVGSIFLLFIILDLILCYFIFFKKDQVETKIYQNQYIKFEYTDDYVIEEKNDNKILIGRDKKSGEINIVITELDNEVLKRDNGFIISTALKEFEDENEDYFSNYYGKYVVGKYEVNDFLYDDGKNQIDLNYIISNNKLILISYVNENKYFDLYEENVLDIINSIEVL